MAAAFSRLQLAAALLEYDNDPENPDAPKRSAHESAIFANFRRNHGNLSGFSRRSDYLGDGAGRQGSSIVDNRQSKASVISVHTLQNPFSHDDQIEEEDEGEDGLEVDLASWGLDAFIPKNKTDRTSRNSKGKAKSRESFSPPSMLSVPSHQPFTNRETMVTAPRRALATSRSMSVGGNLEYFGTEDQASSFRRDSQRRSIASAMDVVNIETPQLTQRRRASSYTPLSTYPLPSDRGIPFPTTSIRSASPHKDNATFQSSPFADRFDATLTRERATSTVSMDPKLFLNAVQGTSDVRQRAMSNATINTLDDNPFTLRPPSHTSRFDPKAAAYTRTMSNASMGSRGHLDDDMLSTAPAPQERDRRYSTTLDLLRPKVLVMPSPLQSVPVPTTPPYEKVRDGFQLSTDGPPLPPGARSIPRHSMTLSTLESPPVASNSFTPNPLTTLSLSQMTFRNTLGIGGERDSFIAGDLPRATEDGQQVHLDDDGIDEPQVVVTPGEVEISKAGRPAGKLYGKSLIDDLENRKAKIRSKQRVFTGDDRPSMMARGQQQRASTLIDPSTLEVRPPSQYLGAIGPTGPQHGLKRRNSANARPLLNFDEEDNTPTPTYPSSRLPSTRSVFGVDTLWEREMTKLHELEAQEKVEEEERRQKEEAGESKRKKKKNKRKDKAKANPGADSEFSAAKTFSEPKISAEPPTLPDIQRARRRAPPHISDNDSESAGSADVILSTKPEQYIEPNWHIASSDEDHGPLRTTGTGPRYLKKTRTRRSERVRDESDDDLPLSVAVNRTGKQVSLLRANEGDSDDEKPLSMVLQKKQLNLPEVNFDNLVTSSKDHDDDDQPLGLRTSRMSLSSRVDNQLSRNGDDDDDKPLAYHPEQQRRTQFQMLAQQQQQLILQAQMQNSMYFQPPAMMASPFFAPPMMPMMMPAPIPIPSPPPMHDEAKFGRVDRWRRNVAVEGDV